MTFTTFIRTYTTAGNTAVTRSGVTLGYVTKLSKERRDGCCLVYKKYAVRVLWKGEWRVIYVESDKLADNVQAIVDYTE